MGTLYYNGRSYSTGGGGASPVTSTSDVTIEEFNALKLRVSTLENQVQQLQTIVAALELSTQVIVSETEPDTNVVWINPNS